MNAETAILIALGLGVMITVALYGSTSGVFAGFENFITGENGLLKNASEAPAQSILLITAGAEITGRN